VKVVVLWRHTNKYSRGRGRGGGWRVVEVAAIVIKVAEALME